MCTYRYEKSKNKLYLGGVRQLSGRKCGAENIDGHNANLRGEWGTRERTQKSEATKVIMGARTKEKAELKPTRTENNFACKPQNTTFISFRIICMHPDSTNLVEEVDRIDVVFEDREFQELRARFDEHGFEFARLPIRPLVRIERQISAC